MIGHLQTVNGDVQETAMSYELSKEEVLAVLAFYRRHKTYIDALNLIDNDYDWPER